MTIAAEHGISSVSDIWDHSDNQSLRDRRPLPTVLAPGDVVTIPDREGRTFTVREGGNHRFVAALPRTRLKIRLRNSDGALRNEAFKVHVAGRAVEGTTDGDGLLDVPIPALAQAAVVELTGLQQAFGVRLGHLDPVESERGTAARLSALGYGVGAETRGAPLERAIERFRADHNLTSEGEDASADLFRALVDAYGA
ncbi:MAG: hypothetical protein U0271_00280 [Polyangiaceae bacterium]